MQQIFYKAHMTSSPETKPMGKITAIGYCDSTINSISGCDGCELWNPKAGVKDCYAGRLVTRYAGNKGYPPAFNQPTLFIERIEKACAWSDLTGTRRKNKPWLDGMPRIIFLNDLSDTFTESIDPETWLPDALKQIEKSPHIWLFLTKRAAKQAVFFGKHNAPENVWTGVSVTSKDTLSRLTMLARTISPVRWVSFEPLRSYVYTTPYLTGFYDDWQPIDWACIGGGSQMKNDPALGDWAIDLIEQMKKLNVAVFFKQFGEFAVNPNKQDYTARKLGGDSKGGRLINGKELTQMPLWKLPWEILTKIQYARLTEGSWE